MVLGLKKFFGFLEDAPLKFSRLEHKRNGNNFARWEFESFGILSLVQTLEDKGYVQVTDSYKNAYFVGDQATLRFEQKDFFGTKYVLDLFSDKIEYEIPFLGELVNDHVNSQRDSLIVTVRNAFKTI